MFFIPPPTAFLCPLSLTDCSRWPSLSLVLPEFSFLLKRFFFLSIIKCLLIGHHMNVGVFLSIIVESLPTNIQSLVVSFVVVWRQVNKTEFRWIQNPLSYFLWHFLYSILSYPCLGLTSLQQQYWAWVAFLPALYPGTPRSPSSARSPLQTWQSHSLCKSENSYASFAPPTHTPYLAFNSHL